MTTFYCDYEGGSDAADGTTFANRWKTLTLGATAARIAPGDTIRLKASPEPSSLGQSATWTDGPLPATFVPTSSTNTSPIVFTKADHSLVTGDTVIVQAHTTNANANGVWDVTVDGDTFTLLNADGSNSVGNGVGGASGTVRKITNSVVKLTTPVTQNIASFGNSNSSGKQLWTVSPNITRLGIADYKEGYASQMILIGADFTTGLAAYFPTGLLDLSAYQQVSFWIKQVGGTLGVASSWSLALCSDVAGTVVVDTIDIPKLGALNRWSPITVDLGHALGSVIQSIAFIVNTDNGAQQFYIDNIIACKAASAADSLSNVSLLGKNTGTEGWYGIQSINGTRVILDMDTNCIPGSSPSRGYSGVTETIETWKRETTKTTMVVSSSTIVQELKDSGVENNLITFSGGWNRTDMSTQIGDTYFDGQNGLGRGISTAFTGYNFIEASFVRYYEGLRVENGGYSCFALVKNSNNNTYCGVNMGHAAASVIQENANNNAVYGAYISGGHIASYTSYNNNNNLNNGIRNFTSSRIKLIAGNCNNNNYGVYFDNTNWNRLIQINKANGNDSYGVYNSSGVVEVELSDSSDNKLASVFNDYGVLFLKNSVLNSLIKVVTNISFSGAFIWSTNENGNTDTHFGYTSGGLISSDITTVHTAGGMSWKLSPTSAIRSASHPLPLKVAVGATAANTPITCKVWFRRDNIGITARLVCKGGQLTGIDNDVSTLMTAAADTWEEVSVTVIPTQKGVLEFYAECYGGTNYNLWTDDVSFS